MNNSIYNPFKATVEAIMEMCKKYAAFKDERANDFLNNIRVKCKDAVEYDKMFPANTDKELKKELDNDLEKEILNEWRKHAFYHSDYHTDIVQVLLAGYQDIARHFANWQKSQPQLEKLVNTSYENGYKQCKEGMEDMVKNAIDAEIVEVEDVSYSMNAHTHLEISTDEDLEKNYKDGDKLSLIILKKE